MEFGCGRRWSHIWHSFLDTLTDAVISPPILAYSPRTTTIIAIGRELYTLLSPALSSCWFRISMTSLFRMPLTFSIKRSSHCDHGTSERPEQNGRLACMRKECVGLQLTDMNLIIRTAIACQCSKTSALASHEIHP